MKRSRSLVLVGGLIISGSLALVLTREPSLLTDAAASSLTEGQPLSSKTFTSVYRLTMPSASNAFADDAETNTQAIIDYNKTNPLPTFTLLTTSSQGASISHSVQCVALGFGDWTFIPSDNGLQRPFRIQKTGQTTEPEYVPLGFFLGVHGIRKITFTTISLSLMTSSKGEHSIAVCLASLDGTQKYNLPYTGNYTYLNMDSSGTMATQYTFTLPDATATDWTPRWIYIAGSFIAHNLATDTSSTKEEDKETYYCDLISFTVYYNAEC
jgi:hypothetical protein